MNHQGYLIANFSTGFDKERQPWLLPDDAQDELYDGFVYRGVWEKRAGYDGYANGGSGGFPYCESRMIHTVTVSSTVAADGVLTSFSFVVAGTTKPLRRGGFRAIDKTSAGVQSQIIQDNGIGGTLGGSNGTITSVLNYTTTLATPQTVTFTVPPPMGHLVTLELDVHQGEPVMGIMNFYTQLNTKELIVADTTYVNRYDSSSNRLDDISPTPLLSGGKTNFMSWVNYPTPQNLQRLLFVNFKDPVQRYDGNTVSVYPIYTVTGTQVSGGVFSTGDGGATYTWTTPLVNTGLLPNGAGTGLAAIITAGAQVINIDQFGVVSGDGSVAAGTTIDLLTARINVTFNAVVLAAVPITITYTPLTNPIDTALHISQFKDRLVVEYTKEGGVQFGHRLRISGTGAFCDTFTEAAIGAGVIDIPSETFISSSDFNRDDRLIFTQTEVWSLKYTGNDIVPFALNRIDATRGSNAPYGSITYLNKTNAVSSLGFILTDGYSVERADDKIPDFSINTIDQDNFNLCFAGSVDRDRDHYLIFPTSEQIISDQILVTNYEEDNYCLYRIPLSCMGTYILAISTTWNDLAIFDSWDEMATEFGDWNSFAYTIGTAISIGGGHRGEIFNLNNAQTEDYPVKIRNITIIDEKTIELTTDFQTYAVGDVIAIESVQGIPEVNNKQFAVVFVAPNQNYVFQLDCDTNNFSTKTYTSGGQASKCIQFECKTKKFNPFANVDKKVSCGWMYFYVTTTGTDLTINKYIFGATQTDPCSLYVPGHNLKTGDVVYIDGVIGMTELNQTEPTITVINSSNISLDGVDSSMYADYVSGGFVSTPEPAILQINCITNDREQSTDVFPYEPSPYQVNLSSHESENGIKKWYKLWINQTARFIQFQVLNNQSGSEVKIHAMMPGFAATGRLV